MRCSLIPKLNFTTRGSGASVSTDWFHEERSGNFDCELSDFPCSLRFCGIRNTTVIQYVWLGRPVSAMRPLFCITTRCDMKVRLATFIRISVSIRSSGNYFTPEGEYNVTGGCLISKLSQKLEVVSTRSYIFIVAQSCGVLK